MCFVVQMQRGMYGLNPGGVNWIFKQFCCCCTDHTHSHISLHVAYKM